MATLADQATECQRQGGARDGGDGEEPERLRQVLRLCEDYKRCRKPARVRRPPPMQLPQSLSFANHRNPLFTLLHTNQPSVSTCSLRFTELLHIRTLQRWERHPPSVIALSSPGPCWLRCRMWLYPCCAAWLVHTAASLRGWYTAQRGRAGSRARSSSARGVDRSRPPQCSPLGRRPTTVRTGGDGHWLRHEWWVLVTSGRCRVWCTGAGTGSFVWWSG